MYVNQATKMGKWMQIMGQKSRVIKSLVTDFSVHLFFVNYIEVTVDTLGRSLLNVMRLWSWPVDFIYPFICK